MNKITLALGTLVLILIGAITFLWTENATVQEKSAVVQANSDAANERANAALAQLAAAKNDTVVRDRQITTLRADSAAERARANDTVATKDRELAAAKAQIEKTARELAIASADKEKAEKDAIELETKLTNERARVEALNADLAKFQDESKVEELTAKIKDLEAQLESAKNDTSADVKEVREEPDDAPADKEKNDTDVAALNKKIAELEAENAKLKYFLDRRPAPITMPYRGL